MAEKQLVLVVESTAAMEPYWSTIVSNYLEKIIRSFCGDEDTELTLVNFNARAPSSSSLSSVLDTDSLVHRSGWTTNVDVFMEWLSGIHFSSGGGVCDAAIAEGLAEVLMMFSSVYGNQNPQRHCILVAASNPYPIPTPVYKPPDYLGIRSESHNSDAQTVAKYLKQCLVSLSVICPRKLPKLKAIYNAAKINPSETDEPIDIVKNPDHLILISKDFMEARATLTQPQITDWPSTQSPMEMDVTLSEPEITKLPSNQSPTLIIDLTQDSSPVSDPPPTPFSPHRNIPPATVKEPSTVSSMASAPSSSTLSTSHEMTISSNDNVQNSRPFVPVTTTKPPTPRVASKLKNLSRSRRRNYGNLSKTLRGSSTTNVVNDSVATNVGPAQGTSSALQSESWRYIVKLWEGDLTAEKQGQPVLLTRLEGYRTRRDSESLAKDWPSTIQIDSILSEDDLKNQSMKHTTMDYIVFRAMNEHIFLTHMQENKLSALIKLPSQLLMLSVSANKTSLVGRLIRQEMVIYQPPMWEQPQQGQDSWQGHQSMSYFLNN